MRKIGVDFWDYHRIRCSVCGEWIRSDKHQETVYGDGYVPRWCPNNGRKVVEMVCTSEPLPFPWYEVIRTRPTPTNIDSYWDGNKVWIKNKLKL